MALLQYHTKKENIQDFNSVCDEAIQLSIRKWHQLPKRITNAHIPILQNFQLLVELHDASHICASLAQTNERNLDTKSAELKLLLGTWRDRLPNVWDDINTWQDLVTWRQHIFQLINGTYLSLLPPQTNNVASNSYAYRGYHETAWIINRFAHVARKHQMPEVCINQLSRIYTLPNIEIQEAFLKLREQAKCHYQNPKELNSGLDVINNTNLNYFGPQQKAEFYTLKGMFLAKLNMSTRRMRRSVLPSTTTSALPRLGLSGDNTVTSCSRLTQLTTSWRAMQSAATWRQLVSTRVPSPGSCSAESFGFSAWTTTKARLQVLSRTSRETPRCGTGLPSFRSFLPACLTVRLASARLFWLRLPSSTHRLSSSCFVPTERTCSASRNSMTKSKRRLTGPDNSSKDHRQVPRPLLVRIVHLLRRLRLPQVLMLHHQSQPANSPATQNTVPPQSQSPAQPQTSVQASPRPGPGQSPQAGQTPDQCSLASPRSKPNPSEPCCTCNGREGASQEAMGVLGRDHVWTQDCLPLACSLYGDHGRPDPEELQVSTR